MSNKAFLIGCAVLIVGLVMAGIASTNSSMPYQIGTITHPISAVPASTPAPAAIPAPDTTPTPDAWEVDTLQVSELDDSHSATLTVKAQNTFTAWPSREEEATLILRCREHKVQAYVITNTAAQPELGSYQTYTTRVRYDKRPAHSVTVQESTDSKALFFSEPVDVMQNLMTTDTFLFAFTPFNSNQATIAFDTRGLVKHVGAIKHACPRTHISMPPTEAEKAIAKKAVAVRVAAFNEEHLKFGPWVHDASNNTIVYWSTKCKGEAYRADAPVYFSSKEKAEAHGFVEEECPDTT